MISEFHHVPGRLRIRIRPIRGNLARGSALRGHLYALDGVTAVRVSEVTGSVTVVYDPARLSLPKLLQRLQDGGVEGAMGFADGAAAGPSPLLHLAQWTGRLAVGMAVEQVVQRSALSVLTALL